VAVGQIPIEKAAAPVDTPAEAAKPTEVAKPTQAVPSKDIEPSDEGSSQTM
jgi:hypothetical protein